jgi:hypothetical protein
MSLRGNCINGLVSHEKKYAVLTLGCFRDYIFLSSKKALEYFSIARKKCCRFHANLHFPPSVDSLVNPTPIKYKSEYNTFKIHEVFFSQRLRKHQKQMLMRQYFFSKVKKTSETNAPASMFFASPFNQRAGPDSFRPCRLCFVA